jgi:hypothetical protein
MWAVWAARRAILRPRRRASCACGPGLIAVIPALTFVNALPASLQSFDSYQLRVLVF